MSEYKLKKQIEELYTIEKVKLSETLKTIPHVCLTSDIWSNRHTSFLGSTLHWINPKTLKRESWALSCSEFNQSHTGANIASDLQALVHEFDLNGKVAATVTDNGSNFVSAFNWFGIDYDSLRENDVLKYMQSKDMMDDEVTEENDFNEYDLDFVEVQEDQTAEIESPSLGQHFRCASHTLCLVSSTDAKKALDNNKYKNAHFAAIGKLKQLWKK